MELIFKQRLFSWFDSYDIYNEFGDTVFTVKGKLSWGHLLKIYDADGYEVGTVKEKILSWLPKFEIYKQDKYIGCISRELSFFKPKYNIDYSGWHVKGDIFEWNYDVTDSYGYIVARVSKKIFNWTDTYSIDVYNPQDVLNALMLVLAIDAEKCSRRD